MIDPTLKNRLVGAAVLLALAVILLPMLFNGANEQALLMDTRIPVAPQVPSADSLLADPPSTVTATEAEIARAHELADAQSQVPPVALAPGLPPDMPVPDISAAEAAVAPSAVRPLPTPTPTPAVAPAAPVAAVPPPAPVADTRLASLAEAWDVQVAAVSTLDSANQLRGKLVAAGYKARVLAAGKLFRVVVGPELRRDDAVALRDKLAADTRFSKTRGMLVRYVP
jgi:DedD protein